MTPRQRSLVLTLLTLGAKPAMTARAAGVNVQEVAGIIDSRYTPGNHDPIERDRWIAAQKVRIIP